MPIERRVLEQTLLLLGFSRSERRHRFFELFIGGRKVAQTEVSRGTSHRTVSDNMVAKVARDLHISRAFLYELARGAKTPEDYLDWLRDRGLI